MKFIFAILMFVFVGTAFAAAPSELAKINSEIKKTEQQNQLIEKKVQSSAQDVEDTKKKLVKAADKYSDLEFQRAKASQKISELDKKREELVNSLSGNRANIADSAASILFISSHPNFDSENMHDYVLTSALLATIANNFDEEVKIATKQIQELEEIIKSRATEKEKLDRTAKKYKNERNNLDKLLKTRSDQNTKLKNQQTVLKQKLDELSKRAKNISELSTGVGNSKMSETSKFSSKKLKFPVRGKLVVKFGETTALGLQSDGWRIRVRDDALVTAPADGIVKFADNFKGFGKVIIISHKNGYNTVMTNFGSLEVLIDQRVMAGEPIGRMDSDKSEMYLEVRRGSNVVDPARLFNEP